MIILEGVSKTFSRDGVTAVTAVQPVDLHLVQGSFTVLVGANGSGKSTLLDLIAGAQAPSTGRILLRGTDVTRLPEHRRSAWIARVFQNPLAGTASELSILDNFRLAALRTRRKRLVIGIGESFRRQVRERIAELGMGLEDKLEQPIGTLSGGQRQALTLLMSTMDRTDVLLLDEPTAALDPGSARVVMDTARRVIRDHGLTAVLVTHNLGEALAVGDRLIQMGRGAVVRDLDAVAKSCLTHGEIADWFP
ncbi:MAG: ATP-binding cassette domain-containing protein [Bacteroidales bacterium]|nr:ATP-binding cassette domain-containing protein [Bacteroidales bacterium]